MKIAFRMPYSSGIIYTDTGILKIWNESGQLCHEQEILKIHVDSLIRKLMKDDYKITHINNDLTVLNY